jgi:16S rRNA (cytosine1402-N4)-methyltransferase
MERQPHLPVLYQEIITALAPTSSGRYVDATLGAGGHSWGILEASQPDGQLLGLDLDPQAMALAKERLAQFGKRKTLVLASYTTLSEQLAKKEWESVQGIVIDLGVSSMQLDTPERGFSFRESGPLDMRFSPDQQVTAAEIINTFTEEEIADIIWQYGEEKNSRRIAKAICQARPLETTGQLADVIEKKLGKRQQKTHPATKTFQAIRIAVNQELRAIEEFLPQAVSALAPGGILAVISFHSLEDRLVKQYFRFESKDCICPPQQPICTCDHHATVTEVNRKPIVATEEEIKLNPRARSARLRIVKKR